MKPAVISLCASHLWVRDLVLGPAEGTHLRDLREDSPAFEIWRRHRPCSSGAERLQVIISGAMSAIKVPFQEGNAAVCRLVHASTPC
jgi:hypothetical protein